MTVLLMNLLGGGANLPAEAGSEGFSLLGESASAAFDDIMAAQGMQQVSVAQLQEFFLSRGGEMPALLKGLQQQQQNANPTALSAMLSGKKLPGHILTSGLAAISQGAQSGEALNLETSASEVATNVSTEASSLDSVMNEIMDVMSQLPQRELTPEELSELVQQTGLPPVAIFAALQDTPAASPNLAFAMVDDMGVAEADANLPLLPTAQLPAQGQGYVQGQTQAQGYMDAAQATEQALPLTEGEIAMDQPMETAEFASFMDENKLDVLKRITQILRGEKTQGEFEWAPKPEISVPQPQQAKPMVEVANAAKASPAGLANNMPQELSGTQVAAQIAAQNSQQSHDSAPVLDVQQPTGVEQVGAPRAATPPADVAASPLNAPRHTPSMPQAPAEQVVVHIQKAIAEGGSKVEIQLQPHTMGKVEVRIDTDQEGNSHVTVTAERRDTLELLQRDARGLERALSDAGLKADSNSLSFNLRGGDGQQQHAQTEQHERGGKPAFDLNATADADMEEKLTESEMALTYSAGKAYRLNIDRGVDISV